MGRGVYWMMLVPLVTFSGPSYSQQEGRFIGYNCTLQRSYDVSKGAPTGGPFIGQSFLVERSTGKISGSLFELDSWDGERILDSGSDGQSYKVIYLSPPKVSARLLVVNEYQEGRMKEFVLMDNSTVYAGLCENFRVKWRRITGG
jgi:hypothetical protein